MNDLDGMPMNNFELALWCERGATDADAKGDDDLRQGLLTAAERLKNAIEPRYSYEPPTPEPAGYSKRHGWSNGAAYYRAALEEIAGTKNRTATPQQFADHLQSVARDAIAHVTGGRGRG